MLKMGTYRIPDEPRSNQQFPIYQKLARFDWAYITTEQRSHISRERNRLYGNPSANMTQDQRREIGRKGGRNGSRENKIRAGRQGALRGGSWFTNLTPEQRREMHAKVTAEQWREYGHRGGIKRHELYGGNFTSSFANQTKEQRSEKGRKGAHVLHHVRCGVKKIGCDFCFHTN
jgi:general stress protein YciG